MKAWFASAVAVSALGAAATPVARAESGIAAVWANDGGDKVCRGERRAAANPAAVANRVWDGETVTLFGARNEVVAFALVIEAGTGGAQGVSVELDGLDGDGGARIGTRAASGDGVFDWTGRNIELFHVRYLRIKGLSRLSYETYDERHIPERFRRPWSGEGIGAGGWADRPDHDAHYPEIAVPIELVPSFAIAPLESQSVWCDIYIPRDAAAGLYTGTVTIREAGAVARSVPVSLAVRDFALPDAPSSRTMLFLGYADVNQRYTGERWPNAGSSEDETAKLVRDRHFQLAHRHRISLIDADDGSSAWGEDRPRPEWLPRLDGSLFTAAAGYDGPGEGVGNGVYAVGAYSTWGWKGEGEAGMRAHSDAWAQWFASNAPGTDYFLYLIDESSDYAQIEQWAGWLDGNPGPGAALTSFATIPLPEALAHTPSLDIAASWFTVGDASLWQGAADAAAAAGARFLLYNGKRPASGSFATEDDGTALRELPWGQYKKGIARWFFWESTYYYDYQSGRGQTDLFETAQTFGADGGFDPVLGETGWNYSNGDGVLFYPGADTVFPARSYGVAGPFASLRLKQWRRGIQDVEYLSLAAEIDEERVGEIVDAMVPKALWEYGVSDPNDPTWVRTDISWPTGPDEWEAARAELADIIEAGQTVSIPARISFGPPGSSAPSGYLHDDGSSFGDRGQWGWK